MMIRSHSTREGHCQTLLLRSVISIVIPPTFIWSSSLEAQEVETRTGKNFRVEREVWTTPAKPQGETGLCALFSDISFLESELHRLGRADFELSTMYVAYHFYVEKALRRIRVRGKRDFGFKGGFNYDAFEMIRKYGIVPLSDYTGLLSGQTKHRHSDFIREMNRFMDEVEKDGKAGKLNSRWENGRFSSLWLDGIKTTLSRNMGEPPAKIVYDEESMSPREFADRILSIPYDDYVKFTSYSYLPFDQEGELLADGNWLHKHDFYNIRLDDYGTKDYKIKDSARDPTVGFASPPTYLSENYFRARVLAVMLHKDGIPPEIRQSLKID